MGGGGCGEVRSPEASPRLSRERRRATSGFGRGDEVFSLFSFYPTGSGFSGEEEARWQAWMGPGHPELRGTWVLSTSPPLPLWLASLLSFGDHVSSTQPVVRAADPTP